MLRIRALKIEIQTSNGLYGRELKFGSGLNVIRGNNTSGKSTCVQAILYGLGMEELLGGKGGKTMQSVLKDVVEDGNQNHQVLESYIYLEFENFRVVTTKRSVHSAFRDFKLIEVYEGAYLTGSDKGLQPNPYYLFDPNAAQDVKHGFHAFLESFLGWQLPKITNSQGHEAKLYLQTLFPAFFIEQKSGWSDFLATIPFLGLRNVESKVVEFLLNMDVIENDIRRQELKQERQTLVARWEALRIRLKDVAHTGSCTLKGYPDKPELLDNIQAVWLAYYHQNRAITIEEYTRLLREEYNKQESTAVQTVGERSLELEVRLKDLEELIFEGSTLYEKLGQEASQEREKIGYLRSHLKDIMVDIEGYKAEIKLQTLGSTLDLSVSKHVCPTCRQDLNGSLLPQNIEQKVMSASENLNFLKAQKKMIEVYIQTAERTVEGSTLQLQSISDKLREYRTEVRSIKKTLVADDRLPSEADIERKVLLKQRMEFYAKLGDKFIEVRNEIGSLVDDLTDLLAAESRIPKNLLSTLDSMKQAEIERYFRVLLTRFGYTSKDPNTIRISADKYLPTVEGLALRKEFEDKGKQNYDIRYDSSASDFVRTIWAYTCVLYKVSDSYNGNHPGLIVMDEPEQHSMADQSIRNLLEELSRYKSCQSIVAASFHDEDDVFHRATDGIPCTVLNLGSKSIIKLSNLL